MELKRYWTIIHRYRWVVVAWSVLTLAASVASVLLTPSGAPIYKASLMLAVKPTLESRSGAFYTYDEYYAYVASEFLIDDLMDTLGTTAFMADLRQHLKENTGREPTGHIESKKTHRLMRVTVTAASGQDALLLAQGIADLLGTPDAKYLARLSSQQPEVSVVDPPAIVSQPGIERRYLDVILRALLGFLAGVGLAFLLDYLDDTVHDRPELEQLLGWPVLGEIPKQSKG